MGLGRAFFFVARPGWWARLATRVGLVNARTFMDERRARLGPLACLGISLFLAAAAVVAVLLLPWL